MSTPPPEPPGPGLEWVRVDEAMIAADIERSLAELALSIMRDSDRDLRLAAARDWVKIERQVRAACRERWAKLEARHARDIGVLQ